MISYSRSLVSSKRCNTGSFINLLVALSNPGGDCDRPSAISITLGKKISLGKILFISPRSRASYAVIRSPARKRAAALWWLIRKGNEKLYASSVAMPYLIKGVNRYISGIEETKSYNAGVLTLYPTAELLTAAIMTFSDKIRALFSS